MINLKFYAISAAVVTIIAALTYHIISYNNLVSDNIANKLIIDTLNEDIENIKIAAKNNNKVFDDFIVSNNNRIDKLMVVNQSILDAANNNKQLIRDTIKTDLNIKDDASKEIVVNQSYNQLILDMNNWGN